MTTPTTDADAVSDVAAFSATIHAAEPRDDDILSAAMAGWRLHRIGYRQGDRSLQGDIYLPPHAGAGDLLAVLGEPFTVSADVMPVDPQMPRLTREYQLQFVCRHLDDRTCEPSTVEEMVMNDAFFPPAMSGWRAYRIEYGRMCRCPETMVFLPEAFDIELLDGLLLSKSETG